MSLLARTLLLLSLCTLPACQNDTPAKSDVIGSWSAAPYGPYPLGPLTQDVGPVQTPGAPSVTVFENDQARDQSFRMIIHPTLSGVRVRVRLSNLVGDQAVRFASVSVARVLPQSPVLNGEPVPLTFQGQPFVLARPGEEVVSDLADMVINAGEDLAVTFHVAGSSGPMTWHAVSFGPQYVSLPGSGDVTSDAQGASFTSVSTGWFFLSGLDVVNPRSRGSLVAIGDSITDGAYQVLNARWTDVLADRLNAAGAHIGILNQGINSNTVTRIDEPYRGEAAVQRFTRDVLQRPGVRGVILFEGTNDLGAGRKADEVITGLSSLIRRARNAGLCVFAGTITPRADVAFGWFPDGPTVKEPERQKINAWLREQAPVDGVIDFDAVLGTPGAATVPNPALYTPDLLHPNTLGFQRMGESIDLQALRSRCRL